VLGPVVQTTSKRREQGEESNVARAALTVFRTLRSGHFLQFSLIDGRADDSPGMGAYQFAVEGFSDVLNAEVRPLGIKVTIAEPGLFRTDREGSSMHVCPVSPDYEQTVGQMNSFRQQTCETWPTTLPARPHPSRHR
jgi:NAD(P)-dependent dehydrogenase (short-subunit alcohol dehydrogenase family)